MQAIPDDERVWVPQAPDVWFRPLLLNTVTGSWCNLLRVRKSGVLSRHIHPSWVTGLVLKGAWRYLEHDWVAREGSFVYEPPGRDPYAGRRRGRRRDGDDHVLQHSWRHDLRRRSRKRSRATKTSSPRSRCAAAHYERVRARRRLRRSLRALIDASMVKARSDRSTAIPAKAGTHRSAVTGAGT